MCGVLQNRLGYDAGFGAAGIGMLIGLATFLGGASWGRIEDTKARRRPPAAHEPAAHAHDAHDEEPLLPVVVVEAPPRPPSEVELQGAHGSARNRSIRSPMLPLLGVCALVIPFWVAYDQLANTVPLFFRERTARQLPGGYTIPAAWLQSVNPLFCITLMPVLTTLWARQARRGAEPSTIVKMALGCALQAAAWLLLAVGCVGMTEDAKAPLSLPIVTTMVLTAGQLYLAPVGLALVSRCCPPHARSTAIALWFCAGGLGSMIAGPIGGLYSRWHPSWFFALLALISGTGGALMLVAAPRLLREVALAGDLAAAAKRGDDDPQSELTASATTVRERGL